MSRLSLFVNFREPINKYTKSVVFNGEQEK